MEITVNQNQVFRSFKRKKLLAHIINFTAAFGASFAVLSQPLHKFSFTYPLFIVSASAVAAAIVLSYFNWRCPVCKKSLGWKNNIAICPGCRTILKPEDTAVSRESSLS